MPEFAKREKVKSQKKKNAGICEKGKSQKSKVKNAGIRTQHTPHNT